MNIASLFNWFSNYGRYCTLFQCMAEDRPWVFITVALDLAVAAGYVIIARHWWLNERRLGDSAPRRALGSMRNIFFFCGICGYLFIPVKMFWPAWRLYDLFLLGLVYFTWRYAWRARDLQVVYNELGRSEQLAKDLAQSQAESRRRSFFLNAVSHDLRTPLNGLMLQADLAQLDLENGDTASLLETLQQIKSSAKVTADLLNSFMEVARLDWSQAANTLVIFDVAELCRHVINTSQALAGPSELSLRVIAPQRLMVKTDRTKLERVLLNLVHNAMKFTSQGGVELKASVVDDGVCIEISDTGIGIAPEDQGRLFQEFFQVHNHERDRRKGFGLGLAVARRLAEQLGGTIRVESEMGKGSRFGIQLPGIIERPAPDAACQPPAVAVSG